MLSGQDYASRLREEIRRGLARHLQALEEDLRALQTSFSTSVAQIARRLGSTLDLEVPTAEAILADAVRETERRKEGSRDEEMLHLARFAHDMRQRETQEEILNFLLDGAHRYAPRLVLFVARGNQFTAWSSRGFADATALRKCSFPILDSQLLRKALDADGLFTVNDLSKESALSRVLPEGAQWPWHAFPMKAIRRPVAVLLASAADGRKCDLESLCILMDLTGLCIENIALKILQEVRFAKPPVPAPSVQPPAEKRVEEKPAALSGVVEQGPEGTPASEETKPAVPADLTVEISTDAGAELEDRVQASVTDLEPLSSASTPEAPPVERAQTTSAALPEELRGDGEAQSTKVDYFHDEVIRILGDNDPSTLGSDYPGPRVES